MNKKEKTIELETDSLAKYSVLKNGWRKMTVEFELREIIQKILPELRKIYRKTIKKDKEVESWDGDIAIEYFLDYLEENYAKQKTQQND